MAKLLFCMGTFVICVLCLASSKKVSLKSLDNQIRIPKDLQRRLAAVTDFTQLSEQFLIPTNASLNETEGYEFVNRSLVRRARTISSTRNVAEITPVDTCSPREITVRIPQDDDPSTVFWPFCTKVVRCGGCCSSDEFVCAPVKSSVKIVPITVMVMKYPFEGATKLFQYGNTQLPMEVHGECQPMCRVQESDCSKHQKYDPDDCTCKCTVVEENCPSVKRWSEQTCACECEVVKECPFNQRFSRDTCMCELRELVKDGCEQRTLVGGGASDKVDLRDVKTSESGNPETKHIVSKDKAKNPDLSSKTGNDGRKVVEIRTTKTVIETTREPVAIVVKVAENKPKVVEKKCTNRCPPFFVVYTDKKGHCGCRPNFS